jgi:hypothetical protein
VLSQSKRQRNPLDIFSHYSFFTHFLAWSSSFLKKMCSGLHPFIIQRGARALVKSPAASLWPKCHVTVLSTLIRYRRGIITCYITLFYKHVLTFFTHRLFCIHRNLMCSPNPSKASSSRRSILLLSRWSVSRR